MKKTRLVVEHRDCNCKGVCEDGPTPYPLGYESNDVGDHCFKQGCNKDEKCSFLEWVQWRKIKVDSFEIIKGVEYAKIRKNW
jgi:hypothetical protein